MEPTLRQLEYIVRLAETLNFREAAELCHVSQPSLSTQVQQLERVLGVQIFERDRRHVVVTATGRAIIARAREILVGVNDLVERARHHDRPLVGDLHLGVIPTVAPYVLPRALKQVRHEYPQLNVFLHEDITDRLVKKLRGGDLDAVLLALDVELGDLVQCPLFEDPFLLAAPEGHVLATAKELRTEDLARHQVLLLDEGHCLRRHALAICKEHGARERDNFRASSLGTLVQMVAGGLGITLVPTIAAEIEGSAAQGIVLRRFADPVPVRRIGLGWRRTSTRGDEFELLGRTIVAACGSLLSYESPREAVRERA